MMIGARFEFELADMWVGVFWRWHVEESVEVLDGHREAAVTKRDRLDVWICLLPCVPMHIVWAGRPKVELMPYCDSRPIDYGKWERIRTLEV